MKVVMIAVGSLCLLLVNGGVGAAGQPTQDPSSEIRYGSGVPAEVEVMYDRGLTWLSQNQSAEGTWVGNTDSHGSAGSCGIGGMCLMAFLASGEDPNFGRFRDNLRRGVEGMIRRQNPATGYLPGSMYHHGFAMLGLAEVYGTLDESQLWQNEVDRSRSRSIAAALELAVRCALTAQDQNPLGGWRYSPDARDADTSVSGAVLMGLLAARNAGIAVPDESIDKAVNYFRSMTSKQGGVGYSGGVGGFSGSRNLQAIATLVYAIGRRKDLPEYQAVLQQTMSDLEYQEHSYPYYFRYYMAQAAFQGDFESWIRWNQLTIRQLREQQNPDGSFPSDHGPACGTAMSLLTLALNYRLLPIYER